MRAQSQSGESHGAAPGRAQASGRTDVSRVVLASNSVPPGTIATIPLYFRPARGVAAGQLRAKITYPSEHLALQSVEPSAAVRKAGLELTSNSSSSGAGKSQSTTIEISIQPPASSAAAIPSGVVATVRLKVADQAPHGYLDMKLQATARAPRAGAGTTMGAGPPIANLRAESARIEIPWIDAPPSVNCFFFTH